jgi:cytidine deaminase
VTPAEQELLAEARSVRQRAYAPYSGFLVGAVLRAADGRTFAGVNVESASYPTGMCAERAALAAAVTAGATALEALAVACDGNAPCTPCGMCRQALYEFAPDLVVLAAGAGDQVARYVLRELLPEGFNASRLKH